MHCKLYNYRDLTRTTSSIGTTNAHMAPLSPAPTAIQQLNV